MVETLINEEERLRRVEDRKTRKFKKLHSKEHNKSKITGPEGIEFRVTAVYFGLMYATRQSVGMWSDEGLPYLDETVPAINEELRARDKAGSITAQEYNSTL